MSAEKREGRESRLWNRREKDGPQHGSRYLLLCSREKGGRMGGRERWMDPGQRVLPAWV